MCFYTEILKDLPLELRTAAAHDHLFSFITANQKIIKKRIQHTDVLCEECEDRISLESYSQYLGYFPFFNLILLIFFFDLRVHILFFLFSCFEFALLECSFFLKKILIDV